MEEEISKKNISSRYAFICMLVIPMSMSHGHCTANARDAAASPRCHPWQAPYASDHIPAVACSS